MKIKDKIEFIIPLFVGIIPPSLFLFMKLKPLTALVGMLLIILCNIFSFRRYYSHVSYIKENCHGIIQEIIQTLSKRLFTVREMTEKETLNVISALQNIVKKSKEGAEEAEAVVAYFMGSKDQKDNCFGTSFVARMLQENETAVTNVGAVLHTIKGINKNFLNHFENIFCKIEDIYDFIGEINTISSKTRLLALNATIEAARAQEHGKAFSVVAKEVQKLSTRTEESVSKIVKTIKEAVDTAKELKLSTEAQVHTGSEEMENTEKALQETFGRFKKSIDNISESIKILTISYQAISKDIEKATVSLQFQDAISQEISIINKLLYDYKTEFEKIHHICKEIDKVDKSELKRNHINSTSIIPCFKKNIQVRASQQTPEEKGEDIDDVEFF